MGFVLVHVVLLLIDLFDSVEIIGLVFRQDGTFPRLKLQLLLTSLFGAFTLEPAPMLGTHKKPLPILGNGLISIIISLQKSDDLMQYIRALHLVLHLP